MPFDAAHCLAVLQARQARGEKVFRTAAYKPPTPPTKGVSTAAFLINDVLAPMWCSAKRCGRSPETPDAYSARLEQCYHIGPFLAAQIIADLKHVAPLKAAADCATFARPGPGSERGLNRVRGRASKRRGPTAIGIASCWRCTPKPLLLLAAAGLAPLDAQNLQNCLCEFDKWERARDAGGKASRPYKPPADTKPARKPRSRKEATPSAEQQVTEQQVAEVVAAAAETIRRAYPGRQRATRRGHDTARQQWRRARNSATTK